MWVPKGIVNLKSKQKERLLKAFHKQHKKWRSCDMGATRIAVISSDKKLYQLRQQYNS